MFSSVVEKLRKSNYEDELHSLTISNIKVNSQKKECVVYLSSSQYLSDDILGLLENKTKEFYDKGSIIFKNCPEKHEEPVLKRYVKSNWPRLVDNICKEIPMIYEWLNQTEYKVSNDRFILKINEEIGIDILKMKNIPSIIEGIIYDNTGVQCTVELSLGKRQKDEERHENYYANRKRKEIQITEKILKQNNSLEKEKQNIKKVNVVLGKTISDTPIRINEINETGRNVTIQGKVFNIQEKRLRNNNRLLIISLTDYTNSIYIKLFQRAGAKSMVKTIKAGTWLKLAGKVEYDNYLKEIIIVPSDINIINITQETDTCKEKRVELHLHTNMSAMDGINSPSDFIKKAAKWGHKAIAITDHGVVQAYPEAYKAGKKYGVKVIFGLEAYIIDDKIQIIKNPKNVDIDKEIYVVLDLETTGLSALKDEIIEIGAVKIQNGKIIDKYHTLIKPSIKIPYFIENLTGITQEMVSKSPDIKSVIHDFVDFIGDSTIVAHNAVFDMGFIYKTCEKHDIKLENSVLDTLNLSRVLINDLKNHRLNTVSNYFNIKLLNHHRAVDDAEATGKILLELFKILKDNGINDLSKINKFQSKLIPKHIRPYHATILAKNKTGLENLYKLISKSHLKHFYRTPRILKSELSSMREGLLIGSACQRGEIYNNIINGFNKEDIKANCRFYDFLEVQPIMNNHFLISKGLVEDENSLKKINEYIYHLGKSLGIPVVATGDAHFVEPEDEVFREILLFNQGFEDNENKTALYFRTTDDMLKEFEYLGKEVAKEIVIDNTKEIAETVDVLKPVPDQLYTPKIEGAEEKIADMVYTKAKEIYGDPLPFIVGDRLKRELKAIIDNGFAVIYLISQKLVKKSLKDGYLVGSRGSVGSSLCATMCGITEVNPLPPHYVCPNCKYNKFVMDEKYDTGVDLPNMECPTCKSNLNKEGFNIPFEVFMGFEGDKIPDIDLNFSGEYQSIAHKNVEKIFGKEHVYRAGTIGTIAERTAYGFVRNYLEKNDINFNKAEIDRLVKGCIGIKRTTGQHPGGLIVVPKDHDIHDFTPIQYPADDKKSEVITTHFEYHAISDRLLKLDILGHDDPTTLKMLHDLTGINPIEIPLDDKKTTGIFSSVEPLNLANDDIGTSVGTLGVPEFGTGFVRRMLEDTKPTTFSELVRISGLSHGTDVWLNNAQDLIKLKKATLPEVISTRDDIMTNLIQLGMKPHKAFEIMEKVRKGRGLSEDDRTLMEQFNVKNWFIESCNKIKYMFPKAHAVAYVIMAFRIAYFKVHYPNAFYTTYFSIKADEFDSEVVLEGPNSIKNMIKEIKSKGNTATQKEKNKLTILEVALEAYYRDVKFSPVDLYKSEAERFVLINQGILLPFNSLPDIGKTAAKNIVKSREEGKFLSVEDLRNRAKLTKKAIEALKNHGCLKNLQETNQLDFLTLAY